MAIVVVQVQFDTITSGLAIGGTPVTNEDQKMAVIKILGTAIGVMADMKPALIQPAQSIPNASKLTH